MVLLDGTAKELFGLADADSDNKTATEEAMEWLHELLSEGPILVIEIRELAQKVGISKKALRKAKEKLNVETDKTSFIGGWIWSLPNENQKLPF